MYINQFNKHWEEGFFYNIEFKDIFYSFDEVVDIDQLINEYQKITNIDLNKDKIYIFFDEIQKVPDFQSKIKIYYDLYPNIKFILSGSSSLYLQKRESLAGRIKEFYIKTLF